MVVMRMLGNKKSQQEKEKTTTIGQVERSKHAAPTDKDAWTKVQTPTDSGGWRSNNGDLAEWQPNNGDGDDDRRTKPTAG